MTSVNNFQNQVNKLNAERVNNNWNRSMGRSGGFVSRGADVLPTVRRYDFNKFAKQAYEAPRGYAIRENPHTGEREMFVAGTRTTGDWGGNLKESVRRKYETLLRLKSRPVGYRSRYENHLADVARKAKVDVIYGHSRGAALVNDIPYSGAKKIGLDGATIMSFQPYSNDNYIQNQPFDKLIGGRYRVFGRQKNTYVNPGRVRPITFDRKRYGYKKYLPTINEKYHYIYRY